MPARDTRNIARDARDKYAKALVGLQVIMLASPQQGRKRTCRLCHLKTTCRQMAPIQLRKRVPSMIT
jgi:hypothetical protein